MSEDRDAEIARCLKAAKRIQGNIRRYGLSSDRYGEWTEDFEQCLLEVMRLDPTNVEAPTVLGMHFLDERDAPDVALMHLGKALKLKPADKKLQDAVGKAQAALPKKRR
jgi:cytochrome c-type biogenesis protein CcmH/NrfG